MEPPFEKYIRSGENPLGVTREVFAGITEPIESPVQVLEYKHSLDALIEEFNNGTKNPNDVGLAVVWQMGDKWKGYFDVVSYLDDRNLHHRQFHGFTHAFVHAVSGTPAFQVIVLEELISYLQDPQKESEHQKETHSEEAAI